jgi:hypothetical protein
VAKQPKTELQLLDAVEGRNGNRSRGESDKLIVPENHGERQEGQHFVGNDQEETWRESLYWFQPFTRPTLRKVGQTALDFRRSFRLADDSLQCKLRCTIARRAGGGP